MSTFRPPLAVAANAVPITALLNTTQSTQRGGIPWPNLLNPPTDALISFHRFGFIP
jgi:hypothetical protein